VDEVVVAVPEGALGSWPPRPGVVYVAGGATRQESVHALARATAAATVLVHDVARPFLTADVVARVLAAAREHGAATAALPVTDTVVTASGDELDRASLRAVQTPQGFDRALLLEAHEAALAAGAIATDDAALVRRLGRRVALVEGSPLLIQATRPDDLLRGEAPGRAGGSGGAVTAHERAPGKVNLGLAVLTRRGDGFHELETLFARLELADELELALLPDRPGEVDLSVAADPYPGAPKWFAASVAALPADAGNLAARAAAAYLARWAAAEGREPPGAALRLVKRLPVAAGLGGGSSDAAAALRALVRLVPGEVDVPALALELG